MPEMTFTVEWPDGQRAQCYSPSLVMHDHLEVGAAYPIAEFVARTSTALDAASDRVREKFGFACTSAMAQRDEIVQIAGQYGIDTRVRVIAMEPPLPTAAPDSAAPGNAAPHGGVPQRAAAETRSASATR